MGSSPTAHRCLDGQPPSSARSHSSAIHDPVTAALWHHDLDVEPGPAGRIALLSMAGDIDTLTLPLVCAALVRALETRPADLVIDLAAVRFCGVRGFAMLAATARATRTQAIGYAVSGAGPHLDRGARQVWSDHRPVRYPTLAVAIAAIRREQTCRCAFLRLDRRR
jgi:anti-sigma B factor antagonist